MISNWLSAALARRNIHYGWVMVAVTFLTSLISAGTVGAPGVFIVPLQHEFGVAKVLHADGPSLGDELAENVAALVVSLAMTQVWQLMLLWGVVVGVGTGMTALVLGATIAARWFTARRGLVVGILTASVATGQLVFLPLLAGITERMGWRIALTLIWQRFTALTAAARGLLAGLVGAGQTGLRHARALRRSGRRLRIRLTAG